MNYWFACSKTIKVSVGAFSVKEMVKFSTSENLKSNKIYLDNWRPNEKDSNWSKSVNFIELEPKCRLETFFDENFEKPMGIWRGGYEKKGVHQAWISFISSFSRPFRTISLSPLFVSMPELLVISGCW